MRCAPFFPSRVIFLVPQDQLSDKVEDVREAWETSQNPWVYRASELWDWATHETDTAVVLKELRKLDPGFSLEVS
jgi:import inner membrane translocase subunit TIM44